MQGLAGQLGYIRGLGATGVWLTPPVANQWLDSSAHSAGYHGYWAEDFGKVDPHLGTLADYQALSRQLHARGMVLVQDIVVNHTGDYFWYRPEAWQPSDPLPGYAVVGHIRGPVVHAGLPIGRAARVVQAEGPLPWCGRGRGAQVGGVARQKARGRGPR